MEFKEIELQVVYGIHVARYRDKRQALYEHGNEPSSSIKGRKFVARLSD
jgi:hypothetical protein